MKTEVKNLNISQKDKVFHIVNYALMILMTLTCLGLTVYYLIIGDPNNRLFSSLGIATLFIVPILIELIFRCRISNLILLCFIIYSTLAGFMGCVLNFYNTSSFGLDVWYDIFIHGLVGYIFAFIGLIVISRFENYKKLSPWTVLLFCIFLTLAIELVWELMEWFADNCLGQYSQGYPPEGQSVPLVTDTNIDLLCNFIGAIVFAIHFIIAKFTKLKLGFDFIEKELCGDKLIVRKPKKSKNNTIEQTVQLENVEEDNQSLEFQDKKEDEN